VGMLIIYILNLAHITFNFGQQQGLLLEAVVHPGALLSICVIVILVSVLASLEPAFKASRMEPITALRHV
jgi:putative ABC transport system permease protein